MWWVLIAQAGTFDFHDTPIEGELAEPDAEFVFANPSGDAVPPEVRELLSQAHAQEVFALQAQEQGGLQPELQARVDRAYEQAIAAYRRALARAGRSEAPQLHAQLGFLLSARRRPVEAVAEWQAGLALDPHHSRALASHVALGDYLFDQGALLPALAHYQAASSDTAASRNPELGRYAWYKSAWCQYNLSHTERAVEAILHALEGAPDPLARQARRDLVLFVASSPAEVSRQALTRACAGQAGCLGEMLARLDRTRAEQGLPPVEP